MISRRVSKSIFPRLVRLCKREPKLPYSTGVQEQKMSVNGQTINYVRTGIGSHKVLCFPGALGTIWSDFKPQIEGLDKTKFTIVAWDPPGYGFSRPPDRNFCLEFYRNDATAAHDFMKEIGINKFSILGWSDGGISGMILAAKYPDSVQKLVVWGSNAFVVKEEISSYEKIRDVSKWSEKMKAPLVKLYGLDGLQKMWNGWCDALAEMFKQGGDICKGDLSKIQCPTFILHGDKDPLVAPEHPLFLLEQIKKSNSLSTKSRAAVYIPRQYQFYLLSLYSSSDLVAVRVMGCVDGKGLVLESARDSSTNQGTGGPLQRGGVARYNDKDWHHTRWGHDANAHHLTWGCADGNSRGKLLHYFIISNNLLLLNQGREMTFDNSCTQTIVYVTLASANTVGKVYERHVWTEASMSNHKWIKFSTGPRKTPDRHICKPGMTGRIAFQKHLTATMIHLEIRTPNNVSDSFVTR